ncbi:hypothetical protein [Campylobacter showae]|uniref:Uncharacterized protein n=1 Tax=Campylobacter showae RM3277 TaxID=553219 RepID=C6REC8_9BACT|nr:hypothetical protein [Campylobacter showae]EET80304.1 hypothetical protein CAMSH0001_2020 [Campylobacter showae RM3277]
MIYKNRGEFGGNNAGFAFLNLTTSSFKFDVKFKTLNLTNACAS